MPPPSVAVSNCRGLFRFLLISHVSCLRLRKIGGTWKWHPYFIVFFAHVPSCNSKTWGQVLVFFLNKTSARGYIWWLATHFHVISIVKWYNVPVVADQSPDHILECASICKVIGVIEPELLLGWTMEHNGTHQTEQQVFVFNPFPQEERLQQPLGFRLQTPSASQFHRQLAR